MEVNCVDVMDTLAAPVVTMSGEESVMGVVMSSGLNMMESRVTVPAVAYIMMDVVLEANATAKRREEKVTTG